MGINKFNDSSSVRHIAVAAGCDALVQ